MSFLLLRSSLFSFIFLFITFFAHKKPYVPHQSPSSVNILKEAITLINESDPQDQIDESTEKAFVNKKIDALLEFDTLTKTLSPQTTVGLAALLNRIENPINKKDILEKRQKIITFLAQNPQLLDEIKALLVQITPEIEQILLENTADSNWHEKKLYCQSSLLIPKSIATIINSSAFLLALWQVVPHVGGFLGTMFDPIMHLAGFSNCSHNHGHSNGHKNKKTKDTLSKPKSFFKKIPYKDKLSNLSLFYTCLTGTCSLYSYYTTVQDLYKKLLKKTQALQIILMAAQAINEKIDKNQSLAIIKQTGFEKSIYKLIHSIKGSHNIGSLAQLQYFLNNPCMKDSLKKMLYSIAKADLYTSLATALLDNKVTLCSYIHENTPYITIKQGIGSKESSQKIPNDFIFTKKPTIITGPGGSGKSEYLAMIIANIISAQSLGIILQTGNSECTITPLDYIITHSNITDTRGVESTSQAEAKKLKEYHEYLQNNPTHKGIIAFDELLKHANPHVAEKVLIALVSFFNQYPQLVTLYTTHFEKVSQIENSQQLSTETIEKETGKQTSTYKIVHGANNRCTLFAQLSHALGEKLIFT